MLKPYVRKAVVCNHKDVEEQAIANIVYAVYQEMKKSSEGQGGKGDVSKWVLADRVARGEE